MYGAVYSEVEGTRSLYRPWHGVLAHHMTWGATSNYKHPTNPKTEHQAIAAFAMHRSTALPVG